MELNETHGKYMYKVQGRLAAEPGTAGSGFELPSLAAMAPKDFGLLESRVKGI